MKYLNHNSIDHYIIYIIADNTKVAAEEPNSPTPLPNPEIEVYPGVSTRN